MPDTPEEIELLDQTVVPLLQWFQDNARVLPWRTEPTPYRVWVSEIMLQQTRVNAVIHYFERFMAVLPTPQALAEVSEDTLLKLWQGLGYYNRARNLQKAARQISEQYGGKVPKSYDQLRSLAGIGEYTAGAIASIAYGIPVPAVDGNVLRVISRICGDTQDISKPDTKRSVQALLQQVIPAQAPGQFNQALMELGALICLPNGAPLCERCPLQELCIACKENRTQELPVKTGKKKRRIEERRVWLIFHAGKVALRRRSERGLLAGLWEYPNEPLDTSDPFFNWGISVLDRQWVGTARHIFTHVEWHMTAEAVTAATDALPEGWHWADLQTLEKFYAIPSAFQGFQPAVQKRLTSEEAGIT